MKKPNILIWMAALFCSCSLFKNTLSERQEGQQLSAKSTNLELSENRNWWRTSNRLMLIRDSANQHYVLEIRPRGIFSLSPEKGFAGEADQILIRGSTVRGSTNAVISQVKEQGQSERKSALVNQQKKNTIQRQSRNNKSPSWKWIVAGLLFLTVISWLLYKKLTGKFI